MGLDGLLGLGTSCRQEKRGSRLRRRLIALCLFVHLAVVPLIVNPTAIDYWYEPKIIAIYVLLLVVVVCAVLQYRRGLLTIAWRNNPLLIPLTAYAVSALISTVCSIAPPLSIFGDMFREEGLLTLWAYVSLPVVYAYCIESNRQLLRLLYAVFVCTALVDIYAFMQYCGYNYTLSPSNLTGPFGSTIGNANFLGKYLVLLLPLNAACFFNAARRAEKLLLLAGLFLSAAALVVSFSRGSWLGFCCSLAAFAAAAGVQTLWRKRKDVLVLIALVLLCAGVFELYSKATKPQATGRAAVTLVQKVMSTFDRGNQMGVETRLFAWKKGIERIKERPWFGFGPDTHLLVMGKYTWEYRRTFNDHVTIDRVHNNYLDIAIAQGLVGLAAYLAVIVVWLVWLIRTLVAEQDNGRKMLFCGILAAMVGCLVNDIFIFSVVSVSPLFWSLMGISQALKRLAPRPRDAV